MHSKTQGKERIDRLRVKLLLIWIYVCVRTVAIDTSFADRFQEAQTMLLFAPFTITTAVVNVNACDATDKTKRGTNELISTTGSASGLHSEISPESIQVSFYLSHSVNNKNTIFPGYTYPRMKILNAIRQL